ncbi:hypothetical protein [Sulfitobacter sp.]|uniref:hypothetical protein n=1 Tax=Sulfitobacter sp. TaxID=1903071 RepID=UPI003296DE22
MKRTLFILLSAGAFATVAFDAYGQGISPAIGMAKLAPVGLASSTLKSVFGASPAGFAHLLHTLTGMVAYVLGYFLIARPVQRAIVPKLPWLATAVLYGVVLWIFALYIMAHLVAGMPAFLGWSGITYVALYGHVIYAVVAAWVIEAHGLSFNFKSRDAVAIG